MDEKRDLSQRTCPLTAAVFAARYSSDKPSTVPTQLPRQYTLAQGLAVYIRDGVQSWKSCDARSKRADGSSSSRSSGEHQMSTQYVLGLDEDGSDGRDGPRPNLLNASPTIKKRGAKKKKKAFIITSTDSLPSISVSWKRRRLRPRAAFLKNHKKFISSLDGK